MKLRIFALAALIGFGAASAALAAEPFDIQVILPLTGGGSFVGNGQRAMLQALEESVNKSDGIRGRPVRFVYHDDQTSPQLAVQLTREILAAKPAVIVGSSLVAMCNAMAPLMQNGPVMYCLSPGIHPAAGGYVFSASSSTFDQLATLVRFNRLKSWTKIAVMTSTDATGQDADKAIEADLKLPQNAAIKVVAYEHFNPGDLTVAAQMERIKAAGAEALIAWTTGSPTATVFKGMIQTGFDVPVAPTGGNEVFQQMAQYESFLPKGLVMSSALFPPHDGVLKLDPDVEKVQHEMYAIVAKHGFKADNNTADTWDAALITVTGLRALGPNATAAQLRDWILKLKGFAGINGLYDFTQFPDRGLSHDTTALIRYDPHGPDGPRWQWVSEVGGAPLKN